MRISAGTILGAPLSYPRGISVSETGCWMRPGQMTGSLVPRARAAHRAEDCWSDIALCLGVCDDIAVTEVVADWNSTVYTTVDAIHHCDLPAGAATYRLPPLGSMTISSVCAGITPCTLASRSRGSSLEAEHWISALRDNTTTLGCIRHGLLSQYGKRGIPAAKLTSVTPSTSPWSRASIIERCPRDGSRSDCGVKIR